MKNKLICAVVACSLLAASANAIVTVNIKSTGWGGDTAAANGMTWGLVVATSGGGFSGSFTTDLATNIIGFTPAAISNPSNGTQIFGEYYFVRALSDSTNSGPSTFTDGFFNEVRFNLDGNVSQGDSFGLLWLSGGSGEVAASDSFGFQDLAQLIPTDGTTTVNLSGTPGLATFSAVPEPSTYATLAGLLALGCVVLRRRHA